MIIHEFEPVVDASSKILILGSFPSVKSRLHNFYYGNIQNRFWKMLAMIYQTNVPQTIDEKKKMILDHHLALYDACKSCEIKGSSDHSMKVIELADLSKIEQIANIEKILCNGRKSYDIVTKMIEKKAILMPSTSPANAKYKLDDLVRQWKGELIGS